jgi:hypothetical protein
VIEKIERYIGQMQMSFKKALTGLFIILIFSNQSFVALAHGGEDHGDEKKAPIAAVGQMNSKTAKVSNLEVLIKYPTPKFGEETPLSIYITEQKTNAPVAGVNIAMIFNYTSKTEAASSSSYGVVFADASAIQVSATQTDTPGVYQAAVTFPNYGQYNLSLQLTGSNINEQVTIAGIVVPDKASDISAVKNSSSIPVLLVVLLILLAIAAGATYFLLLRPQSLQKTSSGIREHVV